MSNPPQYLGKRNDGTHAWRVRATIDGKQLSRSFRTDTDSKRKAAVEAEAVLARLRRSTKRQRKGHAQPDTIAELVDDWLELKSRTRAPNTIASYRRHSDLFRDRFGSVLVEELEARDVDRWFGELADTRGSSTVDHVYVTWRNIMRFGTRKRRYRNRIVDEVDRPEHRKKEIRLPTDAALAVVLGDVSGEWGRAIRLLAETGMRRGEVNGLRWSDVDGETLIVQRSISEDGEELVIGPTKGKKSRTVLLSQRAQQLLAEQRALDVGESPWIFPAWRHDSTGQTPHSPSWLTQAWSKHRRRHGMAEMRIHDLRHAWATRSLAAGVPIHVVSAQLGHAQVSTTLDIYGHADESGRDKLRAAMDGQLELNQGETT